MELWNVTDFSKKKKNVTNIGLHEILVVVHRFFQLTFSVERTCTVDFFSWTYLHTHARLHLHTSTDKCLSCTYPQSHSHSHPYSHIRRKTNGKSSAKQTTSSSPESVVLLGRWTSWTQLYSSNLFNSLQLHPQVVDLVFSAFCWFLVCFCCLPASSSSSQYKKHKLKRHMEKCGRIQKLLRAKI